MSGPILIWDEYDALREAVEILEDMYEHESERAKEWRNAAASFYGETLALKLKNRELTAQINKLAADNVRLTVKAADVDLWKSFTHAAENQVARLLGLREPYPGTPRVPRR